MKEITQQMINELFYYKDGNLFRKKQPRNGTCITNPAGSKTKNGYISISIKNKTYLAHRLIFMLHNGYLPSIIDHKNGNKADNRIENLRQATSSQNACNQKMSPHNTGGLKGISPYGRGRWMAIISLNRERFFLGTFDTREEAHYAYCKASKKLHGEFSNTG